MAERGFVPPVARRKLEKRERMRHKERQRQAVLLVGLLVFVASFVTFNVSYWRSIRRYNRGGGASLQESNLRDAKGPNNSSNLRGGGVSWISQDAQPFNQNQLATSAKHLIVVAGHSVTVSGHLQDAGSDENDWFLLSYQKGQGLPQAIQGHIQAGIDEANRDPAALLVFSGGETRAVTGPTTEGQAYFRVSDAMNLWPSDDSSTVRARTTTEEFATDSFENLMFSICRFREVTGDYPQKITVVSFTFKQRRFETLHAPALRWPAPKFSYIGVDPPDSTGFDLERASQGERENAVAPFEQDPYGCHSQVLQQKRKDRNPFSRTPPYALSCPEMKDLLGYCGPQLYPEERLPWGEK